MNRDSGIALTETNVTNHPHRLAIVTALCLAFSLTWTPARAQTVTDPTTAEFDPSTDHNTTVNTYELGFYTIGASVPFQVIQLGKPAPQGDGKIRVNFSTLGPRPAPGINYESRVSAVGAGGTGTSTISNLFVFTPCAYGAAPTSQTMVTAGGSASVAVTTPNGCGWTATSNAGWITVTTGATGSGNGTMNYSVAANATTSIRSGTLTVAGQTITVTQNPAPCSYTVAPTTQSMAAGAGTASATVTTTAGCTWTTVSNATWITVTTGATGTGNGSANYSVTANAGVLRTGTLTMAGRTLTVTQSAPCAFTVLPTTQSMAAAAGTASAAVTTTTGCTWATVSNATWITVTSGATGTGNGSANYSVTANAGVLRTGTLTVAGRTLTVSQSACAFTVSPTTQTMAATGGTFSVTVTTTAGCAWTATSAVGWTTVTGGSGTGSGTVTYSVAVNTGAARSTGLTVAGQTVSLSQGATLVPAPPANLIITSG